MNSLSPTSRLQPQPELRFAGLRFHPMTTDQTVAALAARPADLPFDILITPNAEHAWLRRKDAAFDRISARAWLSTNDSRVLRKAAAIGGVDLGFAPGSHVVERLFKTVIAPADPITIIGGDASVIADLVRQFGLTHVAHHNPPMGFIRDAAAVQTAVEFVVAHPARFVFIAMGPPQSEKLCLRIIEDERSTGLGLCIGSSITTLIGRTPPAPPWMEDRGLVWLYRLVREPGRLWRRYLVRGLYGLGLGLIDSLAFRLRLKSPVRVTDAARLQDWQGRLDQDARRRGVQADRLIALWAGAVLVLMLLYICIGPNPYQHEILVDPLTGGAEASPVNRLVWLGLFGLSAPLLWFRRQALPAMMLKLLPLLLLFAWFALTTRWALDPAVSTRRLILYAINLLICVAIAVGLGDSRRLHLAMATGCAVLVGVDILSWIAAPGVSMTPLGLAAIHSHKNTLGAVMLLAGFVCGTYAWSRTDGRGRAFWWGVTVLALVLLVASLSKTSMGLFAALACATPVIVSLMAQRRMVRWGLIAVAALMVAGVVFGWLAYCLVVGADPWAPFAGITFTQRTEVWAFVWDEFVKRPIQGWGFGSFWDIDPTVQPSLQTDAWFAQPDAYTNEAHNGFLDLAVTTGLIGLTGAVVVLMRWIFGGLILIRDAVGGDRGRLGAAILLGVFPLMVFGHNFMESSYFTANSIFGTVLLLLGVEIERRFIRA